MADHFTVFPAIDLRGGQVVRLKQGDPALQTTYSGDPAGVARRWLDAGASWLHVVNLDGAFGEEQTPNWSALEQIVSEARRTGASVQFGGGLRERAAVDEALRLGAKRVILGTAALENPTLLSGVLADLGPDAVAVSLDAWDGLLQVRGWQEGTQIRAEDTAREMVRQGLRWFVFTDISRDGLGSGINLHYTRRLAEIEGACVIASGGVSGLGDVRQAKTAGCAGIIIGRALYDGKIILQDAFKI